MPPLLRKARTRGPFVFLGDHGARICTQFCTHRRSLILEKGPICAQRVDSIGLVDFETAIEDERFYSGVDVIAGHVVAGLPLPRVKLTDALRDGLRERRLALAVGPSGAGKSALIWLTAFETRHAR